MQFSTEEAAKLQAFEWPSLAPVVAYGVTNNLSHLAPVFPFRENNGALMKPSAWGLSKLLDRTIVHKGKSKHADVDLYPSGSSWDRTIGDLAFHFLPFLVNTPIRIVPDRYLPSPNDLKVKYPHLLDVNVNYETLRSETWSPTTDKAVNHFFYQLMKLLEVPPVTEASAEKTKRAKLSEPDNQDKDEEFVTFMWAALAPCLSGIEDISDPTTLRLVPQKSTSFPVGNLVCTAKFDTALVKKGIPLVFVFQELKRLVLNSVDPVGQKQCEAIAMAFHNRNTSQALPQEVFGIGIQHTKFQFCHAVIPPEYMDLVHTGKGFELHQYLTFKIFAGTGLQQGILQEHMRKDQIGLDITDPDDRLIIVQLFEGIFAYLKEKPLIGTYEL